MKNKLLNYVNNNRFIFYKNIVINNNKLTNSNLELIIKILIGINMIILYLYLLIKTNKIYTFEKSIFIKFNTFYNNINLNINNYYEYFNIFDIKYIYSFKYNIIRVEYKIGFFDKYKNIIIPSNLLLYGKLRLICFINILYNNIIINSLPNIFNNNYFQCIEFFNINEKVKIGIKLYEINENKSNIEKLNIKLFDEKYFHIKKLIYRNDTLFDSLILNNNYKKIFNKINNKLINETLRLKNSYIRYPISTYKRFAVLKENIWNYNNIYNNYFCFCIGLFCFDAEINQKAKYFFYQTIIDNNRNIYNKTDYLFIDFIFNELSSDDAYPIFKEMAINNLPVHYLTENQDIYNEFCYQKEECLTVIIVNKGNYKINGDFLERYLDLFLKLKQVISGGGTYFDYMNNLIYNIEYITYISITHGVCYFKYFLYYANNCYGNKRIDKILIPPIRIIISLAKKYGWKDEDIIAMNLPKWDKYKIIYNDSSSDNYEIYENKYILLLFTWRDIKKKKKISNDYFKNIYSLINNNYLIQALRNNNITLYYTFHHKINYFNFHNLSTEKNFIKSINESDISEYLTKASLVITDFSSIVFDLIYRRKPYVIYIPDSKDESNKDNYKKNYVELIELLKNDTMKFYNKFIELNEAINKIIFYINNNFQLEQGLIDFYDKLGFKYDNNINKFINYLKNLN